MTQRRAENPAKNEARKQRRRDLNSNPQHTAKIIRFIAGTTVFAALIAAPFNDFDYAYYQILRWIVTAWFAYKLCSQRTTLNIFFKTAFALSIITFNPFAPIYLDRETWAIIDITAAMLLPFASLWPKTKRWYTRIALILVTLGAGAVIAYYAGEANRSTSSYRQRTPTRARRTTAPRRPRR